MKTVLACLVHEKTDCVLDLVSNLRALHPESAVLLYNGGPDPHLLRDPELGRRGAIVHPSPQRQVWGKLHQFAIDCMKFALANIPFDSLTIVDSDQLALRRGYQQSLERFFAEHPRCGLAGSSDAVHPANSDIGPVQAAWREADLWRPFLRQFPAGESHFARWTFWPATVFTRDCAQALVRMFAENTLLQDLLRRTRLWATEEVLFPTLAALAGFEVLRGPTSYDYVRFRERYSLQQADAALARPDAFWMHPVNRSLHDPLRAHLRSKLRYDQEPAVAPPAGATVEAEPPLLLLRPILDAVSRIEGWLEEDEADLLMAASSRALERHGAEPALVEIGSYCGRSTVALAAVIRSRCPGARLHAIDPHEGQLGAKGIDSHKAPPTYERFLANLRACEVTDFVSPVRQRSYEVPWQAPVSFLFIDGLHDYENVSRDFRHFEPHLVSGAYVAFHDYADYYPGVKIFVNELLAQGYQRVALARSMIVLRRPAPTPAAAPGLPLVSCIMATCDRRPVFRKSLDYFLRQDYPARELIVVDDGSDPIEDLLPSDPRIRYIRIGERRTIGAKNNLCCEAASGEIMAHWDDDDWMSESRLSYQVGELRGSNFDVNGLSRLYFLDPVAARAWEYVYGPSMQQWVAGGTLCYRKSAWQRHKFEDISEGADTKFIWSFNASEVRGLEDNSFYVATVHARNTSRKHTHDSRWRPASLERLRNLIGRDWEFYEHWPIR